MGEVWRAVDTRKSRTVALKLLPSELTGDEGIEERFRREAQVAARLNDPHVIPIHDYGELHGRLYLDMRLVEGVDLARTLRTEGALPPARAVSILSQVADALDSAHDSGLIHRDVKPSNILLTGARRGSEDFVYLIDFGIAAGSMLGTRLTGTGQTVGTAAYMAPERFAEGRENDPRVDVYALGCALYEMLTGSSPFEGTSFPNLMYQHLNTPPPRPSASRELSPDFDEVVSTALAKDPDQRYRRVGDLADAARAALKAPGPAQAAPPAPAPPLRVQTSPMPPRQPSGPPVPPQSARPTRAAPPSTRRGPDPSSRPRWDLAPSSAPVSGPSMPPPAEPSTGRARWRVVGAITAIVAHVLWLIITITGTVVTFSQCQVSPLGCAGGVVGLVSAATAVVGVVAAIGVLRSGGRNGSRGVGIAWICVGATFVLTLVMAGFGNAATS